MTEKEVMSQSQCNQVPKNNCNVDRRGHVEVPTSNDKARLEEHNATLAAEAKSASHDAIKGDGAEHKPTKDEAEKIANSNEKKEGNEKNAKPSGLGSESGSNAIEYTPWALWGNNDSMGDFFDPEFTESGKRRGFFSKFMAKQVNRTMKKLEKKLEKKMERMMAMDDFRF